MKFVIEGQPLSKARHRSFIRGKHIVSYDPQEKQKLQVRKDLTDQVKKALNDERKEICIPASSLALSSAFEVDLTFHIAPPVSFSPSQRNKAFWGIIKPRRQDVDNLCKFILDAANQVLWPDDRMIDDIGITRRYKKKPKTEIKVTSTNIDENSEASEILGICGPDELRSLSVDASEIGLLRYMTEHDVDSFTQSEREAIASLLSRLSDHHSKMLSKIAKKCPGYHEKHESKLIFDKTSMEGKTLC